MHLPDQFLANQVSVGLIAVSAGFLAVSFKNVFQSLFEKARMLVPGLQTNVGLNFSSPKFLSRFKLKAGAQKKIENLALVAAFVFAMQMLNFPVQNGTSGHFLGGVLAAVVLGPWAGLIAISSVLAVQALVYSDGGIIALGANIFNMGVVGVLVSYLIYLFIFARTKNRYLAIALASWLSVVLASTVCSLELAFSSTIPLTLALPAMLKVHVLIGIGEALITILAIKLFFYEQTK